jgi:hypothetical protein
MTHNVFGLGEGGDFKTNFHFKNATKYKIKLSYEAQHPPLRQTAVMGWLFFDKS